MRLHPFYSPLPRHRLQASVGGGHPDHRTYMPNGNQMSQNSHYYAFVLREKQAQSILTHGHYQHGEQRLRPRRLATSAMRMILEVGTGPLRQDRAHR